MPTYSIFQADPAAPMPNLENLKKRAKQVLRWHREGHHPVAAQIRTYLPRFAGQSDDEILARPFRLGDAQELVARKLGFASWETLQKGLPTMSDPTLEKPAAPELVRAEPQLFTSDLPRSLDFYTQKLGFTVAFSYGEPAFYAQVERGNVALNLRLVPEPPLAAGPWAAAELLAASIVVRDAKALYLELQAKNVPFQRALRTEPWGARTFVVRDPDGNLILFAS